MASKLFTPLQIKEVTLKNRIVISPMCQYSAVDGFANDWHFVHLGSRAIGGAGLIMQEATAVSPEGRITLADLGLWKDEHIEEYKRINIFIEQQGAIPGIQLAHAGRKGGCAVPWKRGMKLTLEEGGWETVAPSPISFHENENVPLALEREGIVKVLNDFKSATERALKAGYKVLEIHAAHGYLLHQFLSPLSNKRKDEYGGSFENRTRLLLEMVSEIQKVWAKNLPLFVRISATDWADGGWDADESVKLARLLKEKKVDLIDTSTGGLVAYQKIPVATNYQVPFAARIKKEAAILTGAVGLITTAKQAEEIVGKGKADLVFIARESLRNPHFPLTVAQELKENIMWPKQYERAKQ